MKIKDTYQWNKVIALVREQYAVMRKHVNGRLGAWGKARFPVRQEKIEEYFRLLMQRKIKTHGKGALDALLTDFKSILNSGGWDSITPDEITFARDIIRDLFGPSTSEKHRAEQQAAQAVERRRAEQQAAQAVERRRAEQQAVEQRRAKQQATQAAEQRRAKQQAAQKAKEHNSASFDFSVTDERIWAQALNEFEGDSRHPGLWAKVLVDAQGNEVLAKSAYLKQRITTMREEKEKKEDYTLFSLAVILIIFFGIVIAAFK